MYYSWTHKFHFLATFSLKMDSTVLFTHLKIILLQYFLVFIFSFQLYPNGLYAPVTPRKYLKTLCVVKRSRCQHCHPRCWHLGSGSTPRTKSLSYTTLNTRFAANPFKTMLFPRSTSTRASLGTSQVISCTSLSVGSLFLFRLRLCLYGFIKLPDLFLE